MSRAKTLWLFGTGLVGAGFVLLLYFLVVIAWKAGAFRSEAVGAVVGFVDQSLIFLLPAPPLAAPTSLQVGMFLALVGVVLGSTGVLIAQRQAERISLEKRRAEDRLRRVHLYRQSARAEPFIGPAARERKRA
ncbi:MAG TPA: hypothetical protein VFZ84_06475 [Burkholderiales bacterium]